MKRGYQLFIFLLLSFVVCLTSCEKEINFKGEQGSPMPVLNCLLTPDSAVSVQLFKSRFMIGEISPFEPITNATVSLFVNGGLKEQLRNLNNGYYKGSYTPQSGDEIKIEAAAEGFDNLVSYTVIPDKPFVEVTDSVVTFDTITYIHPNQPHTITETVFRKMQLQLKLTDAANSENYYFIKAKEYYLYNDDGRLLSERVIELKLSDVLKNNLNDNDGLYEEIFGDDFADNSVENLFSDRFVNGKEITFDFTFQNALNDHYYIDGENRTGGESTEDEYPYSVEHVIEIGEISKDFYNYLISADKALNAEDMGPFSEPVMIHSNIENGIGILASCNIYRFICRFKTNNSPYWQVS